MRGGVWRTLAFVRGTTATFIIVANLVPGSGNVAYADRVIESGFCRKVVGRDCIDPIPDGTQISIANLERDTAAHRLIYFYGALDVEHAKYFMQSIGRGPRAPASDVEARAHSSSPIPDTVARVASAFRVDDRADVLNIVVEVTGSSSRFRAVATRYVHSAGPMAGKIVDPEGSDFEGSQLHTIEIIP